MAKLIFINLPVSDLARATAFYQAIGAVKREPFCDDTASCMVLSDTIHVMLMTHDKYRQFTTKQLPMPGPPVRCCFAYRPTAAPRSTRSSARLEAPAA